MNTIAGLPAHALLVHAIVVLAPLTALLAMLCAVWPAARRRFVWLVLALATVNLVLTPLTGRPVNGCTTGRARTARSWKPTRSAARR